MKSNYERVKYGKQYWCCVCLFFVCLVIWIYWIAKLSLVEILVLCVILTVFFVLLFYIGYGILHNTCNQIERVSDQILTVMESDEKLEKEEFQEGSAGILYSNFYKMVQVLMDSRKREMSEKLFLRDIISDISHQLKTPLASLNVFVDLLLEDRVEDPDKRRQILVEASNQLNRMEWMVLSMLKLARIEAGAIQFEKKEVLLYPLLKQGEEAVRYLTEKRNQWVEILCDTDCRAMVDGDWLLEALINLLKNASDYSGEEHLIQMEVEQGSVYTRILVKDQGPGIPEEEIPNIFKRFYRIHQEVNPNSVGIGLSLTKSIVEGMGGSIHVETRTKEQVSEGEGSYTWFVLTFMKG